MKWYFLPVLLLSSILFAQNNMGFGAYDVAQRGPCLSDEKRAEIQAELQENIALLRAEGRLPAPNPEAIVPLEWPVVGAPGQTDYGYHGVSNFVDLNAAFPNQLLDYNCGQRTYDLTSGYNHRGIDMFTWPFAWYRMDHDEVIIVAAASGTIVAKSDGNFDRSCGFGGGNWNAVFVQHADGSTAWYGHMKENSPTTKSVGDPVAVGEYLGVVGSSGSSTGPHLHFELYDGGGNLIEPYAGTCNNLNNDSWWANQRDYFDSGINRLMTHFDAPVFPACPQQETLNESNHFMPGDRAYFATYYRDQLDTQESIYTVYRPDNSIFQSWSHFSNASHYSASYWYWWWTLPANAPSGVWKFEVVFEGVTYSHNFTVGVTGLDDAPATIHQYALEANFPNPFNPTTAFSYSLEKAGPVQIKIYNALGQEVRLLVNEAKAAGQHTATWDGKDNEGAVLPGGFYFYRMAAGDFVKTRKMLLVK